jgi:Tfp pilus assembly protein PilX
MKPSKTNRQNGIALFSALMILLLLSAIAASLVMMSNTETSVNANYRAERTLDFGARAGIEEVRDRLMTSNAATLISPTCAPASACLPAAPVVPSTTNNGILYVLGGANPAAVTPWTAGTIYTDDELCHDGYGIVAVQSSDVRCTSVPAGGGWYASTTSNAPWNGTPAALPYQWVRVSWKLNGSVQNYPVDTTTCPAAGSAGCGTPVCWDGSREVLLPAGDIACSQMATLANPVYLLTSLAVNPISGSRKIVQAEVALPPPVLTQKPGFFATSTACGAITMSGGATTDGYSSAHGGTYATTQSNTAGSIGANGNITLSGNKTKVGGNIYVPNTTIGGACPPDGVTESGGAGMQPGNSVTQQNAVTVPPPPLPNPLPPTTNITPTALVPGDYGNISVSGHNTLTLAPGTYDINSISLSGNSTVVISPPGAVVLNVAGQSTTQPIDFSGGSVSNTSGVAANFQINYAGSSTVKLSGGSSTYVVVNAPNAPLQFTGGSDFFGSATGATITDSGGTNLHFDTSLLSNLNSSATDYSEISLRGVAY